MDACIRMAACLPHVLSDVIGIRRSSRAALRDDTALLRRLLDDEPEWLTELWEDVSDHLCQNTRARRVPSFGRQCVCRMPRMLTFAEARNPATWAKTYTDAYAGPVFVHEAFRLTRMHTRMWQRNAPTGLALIY